MESAYISACQKQGIKPLNQVIKALSEESDTLLITPADSTIVFSKQSDNDFFGIGHLLKLSPPSLQELTLSSFPISELSLTVLSEGLESSKFLQKLTLHNLSLSHSKSFTAFLYSLQESESLTDLSLSENNLSDESGPCLAGLLESDFPLQSLDLDFNKFQDFSFALALSKNKNLVSFTINSNPLEFSNLISLLEMLTINKTLLHLGVSGMANHAPAPIKENPSGLLTINEAVTLKLANVIRHSQISSIAIDVDPSCVMQVKELEISICKHNKTLLNLESSFINWNTVSGSLLGIQRALRANLWINDRTQDMPADVEEMISLKLEKNDSFGTSPNKTPQKTFSTEGKVDTTIIENKNFKEMSFGKGVNKLYKDLTINKYLSNITEKMTFLEEKFNIYTSKTDQFMERLEQQISASQRSEDFNTITTSIQDIQNRLEKYEQDKAATQNVVEEYIQKIERLKFKDSEASKRSSRRLRSLQKSDSFEMKSLRDTQELNSDGLRGRINDLEEKVQKLEKSSNKVNKIGKDLKSTIRKVSQLETTVHDIMSTPKKEVRKEVRLPPDAESIVMGTLLEKVKNPKTIEKTKLNNKNTPAEPKRAPSAELKKCLKMRGFSIEDDRPVFRKNRFD